MIDAVTDPRTLLPRNASPLERAVEQVLGPQDPGAPLIHTIPHPERIPAALLPWLAWGERVMHWPAGEAQRRSVAARSHRLHGLIGTAAGYRAGARLVGAQVTRIEAHPGKTFLGWWDADARAQWLAAHPELRLYARRERTTATGLMLGRDHAGATPVRTDAVFRATTRATLVQGGAETDLGVREWRIESAEGDATLELARHDQAPGLHCGQVLAGATARYTAAHRLWAIDQRAYRYGVARLLLRQLPTGFAPLSADAEPIAERAVRLGAGCLGARPEWYQDGGSRRRVPRTQESMSLGAAYPARMDTATRQYRRVRLFDPAVTASQRNGPSYLGRARLGLPAWETELRVQLPKRLAASRFCGDPHGHAATRDAGAAIGAVADVLERFRAEHQRVLIDTRNTETLRVRETSRVGAVVVGQVNPRT